MELKVNEYQLPDVIAFNYEEIKNELAERVHIYETVVYDDTQIKQAKADRERQRREQREEAQRQFQAKKQAMMDKYAQPPANDPNCEICPHSSACALGDMKDCAFGFDIPP